MVQFDCPRIMHPLVSFTLVATVRCPFLWMQEGKGKGCICLVNKVEIDISKISFMHYKWSYFNTPQGAKAAHEHAWCYSLQLHRALPFSQSA